MDTLNGRRWLLFTVTLVFLLAGTGLTVSVARAGDGVDLASNEVSPGLVPAWADGIQGEVPGAPAQRAIIPAVDVSLDRGAVLAPVGPEGAGDTIEVFTNTWSYSTLGLVYDPSRSHLRYVHESQSSASDPTIFDVGPVPSHTVKLSIALSAQNPGWAWELDNRTGAGYDADTDTYFLCDYNGDLANADDNIVEVDRFGNIINAWEMDDEVGSNDSSDGSEIDSIIDIAVVPGTPTRYFATAAYDGGVVYEISLAKTGVYWTPNSWSTVATYTNAVSDTLGDNLGIDYDAQHGVLYHSSWATTTILVTDLSMNPVTAFSSTFPCTSTAGYHSGVTFIEGSVPPEVWVTDFSSDRTTRCEAVGLAPMDVTWGKWIDDVRFDPHMTYTYETSDTIKIVDVITSGKPLQLVERWNPAHLRLEAFTIEPSVGVIVTNSLPAFLEWNIPPAPDVVTMTKWFYVNPSTWTSTLVSETLRSLAGDVEGARGVVIDKEPPALSLLTEHPPEATAGQVATYTIRYENGGGFENDVKVRSLFPATATVVHAVPAPAMQGPGLALWRVGDLPNGALGQIDVFLEIDASVSETQTVVIENQMRNHVDITVFTETFSYDVDEAREADWTWEKAVYLEDGFRDPTMVVPVEASQLITVVDEVAIPAPGELVERWDPMHLELIDFASEGAAPTPGAGVLTWAPLPAMPDPVALTKTFRVKTCTWIHTELWEELFVEGSSVDVRPVFIEKRPPQLAMHEVHDPSVGPGDTATFVLDYENTGGFESGAWITTTFPPEAIFIGAQTDPPVPYLAAPDGRWAKWDIGPLADGDRGTITVTVAITVGLPPSTSLPIQVTMLDHADIERYWLEIVYHVGAPGWGKEINGVPWHPGTTLVLEPSDTFTVVDTIVGPFNTTLMEFWDPQRLELVGVSPSAGSVMTRADGLDWVVPHGGPHVVDLMKEFRVLSGPWTSTPLFEELYVEGDFWNERPVMIRKAPPELWLTVTQTSEVHAGEEASYALTYENRGGYDPAVWITCTFPAVGPFVSADSVPALPETADPAGRWATWDVGDLAAGEGGTITITVAITDHLQAGTIVPIQNYIYDQVSTVHGQVDVERYWVPLHLEVGAHGIFLPVVMKQ